MDYINSYDYAEVLEAATAKLSIINDDAAEFFADMRIKFIDLVNELMDESRQRNAIYDENQFDGMVNPDELRDAYDVPESVLERNYEAWEKFMENLTMYEADSELIRNLIAKIFKTAEGVGGIE